MPFDFPASPSLGQAYYAPNGPVYVWDGVTWQAQPGSAVANVLWSDTAPVSPFNGQLWGNSLTGILYSWYVDPNSSQWVAISGGAPASVKTARTRNRVINPTAQVSQENGSTNVTTTGAYPADQWYINITGIVSTAQRVTFGNLPPEGSQNGVYFAATTAKASLAATDVLALYLPIEGLDVADLQWGTASAKPVVLRFAAMCDQTGTFGFSIGNRPGVDRSYAGSFTITTAGQWQVFSFAIPGDTIGTWLKDTGVGMTIRFGYAFGSTTVGVAGWQAGNIFGPAGCTNGAAVANSFLRITEVGLYADPDATGVAPRFEAPSYEDDLARCMRYWQRWNAYIAGYGTGSGFQARFSSAILPMRIGASVSFVSPGLTNCTLSVYAVGTNYAAFLATSSAASAFVADTPAILNARLI